MKTLRRLHYPSEGHAAAAVIACAVLLAVLVVMWLAVATNTAMLSQQLDANDARQRQLTEEANRLWKQIGDVTSPGEMKQRMQEAGYGTPAGTQYLFVPTAAAPVRAGNGAAPTATANGGQP